MKGMSSPPLLFLLYRASQRADLIFERVYGSRDLSARQFVLLRAIKQLGRRPRQCDIADVTGIDRATVTLMLRILERDGLVVKIPHVLDLRANVVQLTDRGEAKLREAATAYVAAERAVLEAISAEGRQTFVDALRAIATARR